MAGLADTTLVRSIRDPLLALVVRPCVYVFLLRRGFDCLHDNYLHFAASALWTQRSPYSKLPKNTSLATWPATDSCSVVLVGHPVVKEAIGKILWPLLTTLLAKRQLGNSCGHCRPYVTFPVDLVGLKEVMLYGVFRPVGILWSNGRRLYNDTKAPC